MSDARLIPLGAADEWSAALAATRHAVAHTRDYSEAVVMSSPEDPVHLLAVRDGAGATVCPVRERTHRGEVDAVTPYGFSGFSGDADEAAVERAWAALAHERRWVCSYVQLHPVLDAGAGARSEEAYHEAYVLDLRAAEGDLLARMSLNRRRQISRWERERPEIRDSGEATRFFVRDYADFMRSRGAGRAYTFTAETLERLCGMPGALLLAAGGRSGVEAVTLFGYTDHCADFLFNVTTPRGRPYSAGLIWAAIRELRERAVPWINLGGGVRPGDALADFKRRFGAELRPLRRVRRVFRPDAYEELCAGAGVSTCDDAYFPAYRAGADVAR